MVQVGHSLVHVFFFEEKYYELWPVEREQTNKQKNKKTNRQNTELTNILEKNQRFSLVTNKQTNKQTKYRAEQ